MEAYVIMMVGFLVIGVGYLVFRYMSGLLVLLLFFAALLGWIVYCCKNYS